MKDAVDRLRAALLATSVSYEQAASALGSLPPATAEELAMLEAALTFRARFARWLRRAGLLR